MVWCMYHVGQKKLHQIIFLITLSNLIQFWYVLAHMYSNKFCIICIFQILYKMENKEPAWDLFCSLVSRRKRTYWWLIFCRCFKSEKIKKILIKNFYRYDRLKLIKQFAEKGWKLFSLYYLLKMLRFNKTACHAHTTVKLLQDDRLPDT